MHKLFLLTHPIHGGDGMERKETERKVQQKSHDKFDSVTQKSKPENQNQMHNVRKEGIAPINQKR